MFNIKYWIFSALLLAGGVFGNLMESAPVKAQESTQAGPIGTWFTTGERYGINSHVKVTKCGKKLCSEVVWLSKPLDKRGKPVRDIYNSRPEYRNRTIMGISILIQMRKTGRNQWRGWVYDPERGGVYESYVSMETPNRLKVTGCKTVIFEICKSQYWTRVTEGVNPGQEG